MGITVKHFLVNDQQEAVKVLKSLGILCLHSDRWLEADFLLHKKLSIVVTAQLQIRVVPNSALHRVLTEEIRVLRSEGTAYGVVVEDEELRTDLPTAIIAPRSDEQRSRMWWILGASEAQIMELNSSARSDAIHVST